MKAIVVSVVAALGALLASASTAGCALIFADEPTMPKSMIER